jgi:cupin 2 domain-containing protein
VNLFADLPALAASEDIEALATLGGVRVERIVSPPGSASPEGFWYDQSWAEWAAVLAGSAGLLFEGQSRPHRLGPGDHVLIPAHQRHRIAWTDPRAPTIWLAVHFASDR